MSTTLPPLPKEMEVLRQVPLFAALQPETFSRLVQAARIERHAKGDIIFRQGDLAQSAVVVVDGFVKVSRLSANGDETLIHIFGRGESVGESAVVVRDRYSTTAEAVGPAVVVRVPGAIFIQMAREFPDLAFAIINEAQAKVVTLMDEIEILKVQTADQRVLRFLLSLCPPDVETCTMRLPYTKGDIAASLGLKQETLSRSFARLKTIGIEIDARQVTVASVRRVEDEIARLNQLV